MKEINWDDCLISKSAKTITPDIKRAESLIETSKERINLIGEVNEKNCNFIFEDYYTSLLELLQATAFKKGLNILKHNFFSYFLKEKINKKEVLIYIFFFIFL